jgi:TatD DNase family protein
MIDAHCHLNDTRMLPQADALVARMADAGVTGALVVGFDVPSSHAAVELAASHPGVLYAAIGVHPHDSKDLDADGLDALRALAARPGVVAIGEIGLDYHYDHSPRDVQREACRRQLALAAEVGLPVVLHEREATEDLVDILDAEGGWARGGEWHCCAVEPELGPRIARDFFVGIAGWVTFPKMEGIRALVRAVPLDRLLAETDAPYLAPVPYRGKPNEPAYVRLVARAIAEVKGIPAEDVERCTADNVRRAFPRWTHREES